MKNNLFKFAALSAGLFLLAAGCVKPETPADPEPEFPSEVLQKTVLAGESVEIPFTANLDWSIEIEGDGVLNYFWIDDNGTHESKVSGEAGEHTVTVRFSDEQELDNNRKCTVNLTMGGKTQKIAEIDRLKINRTLAVKVAEAFETAFRKVDGKYVYNDVPEGTQLKFISFPEEVEYTLPVKVQTNYDWSVSTPDWVVCDVTEGKAGDTEIVLTAVLSEAVAAGAVAEIKFVDASANDTYEKFDIAIDAFADRVEFRHTTTLEFNAEGQVKASTEFTDGGSIITVLAADGYAIRALGFDGEWHDWDFADWVHLEKMSTSGEGYLKTETWMLTVDANKSEARAADVLVLPASLASLSAADLCVSEDGCPFKEEVQPYLLGRVSQLGAEAGPVGGEGVLMIDPEYDTYEAKLTFLSDSWLKYEFDTDQFYELVYTHEEWSETQILSSVPIASAQVLNYDLEPVDKEQTFWAETWVRKDGGAFKVNYDLSVYERVGAADSELVPECFVALLDAEGNYIAVVNFKVDVEMAGGDGEALTLEGDYGTAEKLTSGDLYSFISSEYGVTDVYDVNVNAKNAVIKLAKTPSQVSIYLLDMESGSIISDDNLYLEGGMDNTFTCYVSNGITETTTWLVVLKDINWVNYLAVLFTYTPGESAPISFAYPDYVQNATIAPYSGNLLSTILGEHYGLQASSVYELKYTGEPQMAVLNVPGEPFGQAAWNNYPVDENYWLSYEMEGTKQMYVNMSQAGESDWFVWMDQMGMPLCVLVCTAEIN